MIFPLTRSWLDIGPFTGGLTSFNLSVNCSRPLDDFAKPLDPFNNLTSLPVRRNCCLFLALIDIDDFDSTLLFVESGGWYFVIGLGYWSVIGLAPMKGNLVLVANELIADDDEEGDGVVGKELLTETIPESTEFLSLD